MRRTLIASMLGLVGVALLAGPAWADVIIRGPFGNAIVVQSPVDVRVGPGVVVGTPGVGRQPATPVVVSKPAPVVRPDNNVDVLPPPRVLSGDVIPTGGVAPAPQPAVPTPIAPADFVKNFRAVPAGGNYNVLFIHPLNRKAVEVAFNLPAGNPRVTYHGTVLLFDYGRGHDVEIRFQAGGKVRITQR